MEFKTWKFDHYSEGKLAAESFKEQHPKIRFPTMTFPDNFIKIFKNESFSLTINCLKVLSTVREKPTIRLSASGFWKKEQTRLKILEYDWTFQPHLEDLIPDLIPTSNNIDYAKLSNTSFPILYYAQVLFMEDELDDNGLVQVEGKLRVMEFGFFLMFTHLAKIDREKASFEKIYRLYHEFDSSYLLLQVDNDKIFQINL
jgi:hypothetical protein